MNPQFAGQTKEKLSSRESATFVSGVVKDAFALWLNQHPEAGEKIAQFAIGNAQERSRAAARVTRKRLVRRPGVARQACGLHAAGTGALRAVPGRGRLGRRFRETSARSLLPGGHAAARQDPEHLGSRGGRCPCRRRKCTPLRSRSASTPARADLTGLRYHKVCILADADSDGAHIATLLCALFLRHFRPLVLAGHVFVAMPPLFRIDVGKNVYYALGEHDKAGVLDRIQAEGIRGKPVITRFKGLGEMSPLQLRETTMARDTRRLVQLTVDAKDGADELLDKLLAKKRAADRREWLETKGNLATVA